MTVEEAIQIKLSDLIIERLEGNELQLAKILYSLLHSEEEEEVFKGVCALIDGCENIGFKRFILKIKPTLYSFILIKNFETRYEILGGLLAFIRTMDREVDGYVDFCIKNDKYFVPFLQEALIDPEVSQEQKRNILFTIKTMLNNTQLAGVVSSFIPSVMLEYSPTTPNRDLAAFILFRIVNLTLQNEVVFIKNNGFERIYNIIESEDPNDITTGVTLLVRIFSGKDQKTMNIFNKHLLQTNLLEKLRNYLDSLKGDLLLRVLKLLRLLIRNEGNLQRFCEEGIMLYLMSLIEFPFKDGVDGECVSVAFNIIQYVFYSPETKSLPKEYGFTNKLIQGIQHHKELQSFTIDVILNTMNNVLYDEEMVNQLLFFDCIKVLTEKINELTPKQQTLALNILAHLQTFQNTLNVSSKKEQKTGEVQGNNMQKVLESMHCVKEEQAKQEQPIQESNIYNNEVSTKEPMNASEGSLNISCIGEEKKEDDSSTPKKSTFQAGKKHEGSRAHTYLGERKSIRIDKNKAVTKDMLNLPTFSQVANSSSKVTVNDAQMLAELNLKKEKRRLIVQEMYTTEKTYVNQMEKFVTTILPTLIQLMPPAEEMIGNYKDIYELHKEFLKKLEERFNSQKGEALIIVSDIFRELFNNKALQPEYLKYLSQSEESLKYNYAGYSSQMKAQITKWTQSCIVLPNFLILPVQRLPRYILLLETLLKSTPEIVQDEYHALKEVYLLGKKVTTEIDQEKKKMVKAQALLNYSRTIQNYSAPNNRQFLRDSIITVKAKSKLVATVILMSDMLYVCTKKKHIFIPKYTISLLNAGITSNNSDPSLRTITLTSSQPKEPTLTLFFPVDVDFDGWLLDLKMCIKE
ncbi:hypothetical protein ENUP19_0046G0047 [Entamoeba nuttalli]|uniref:GrfA protein, putative n=2 Tax=Entamoeba nuttalli TaxID=412467 RepID=K2H1I0_ENTNP|nr:GrfA protein, putative [Entamoeba nuttalli P19]EKE40117.1 GrfA protein, putative [Entamoeba nuttalli P19]|eukprot:XP_008857540.1 GrfA protein, putative [Entamoeba nuttalli P19]